MNRKQPAVYMLASSKKGTLYVGASSNLPRRVWQHKHDLAEGFTQRYAVHRLVWYELHDDMYAAISREKAIKNWKREWKIKRIVAMNPEWRDLYEEILA